MVKKINHTTQSVIKTKNDFVYYDDYYCINDFKRKPVSTVYLDEMAKRLRYWADGVNNKDEDGDEPLRMDQFYAKEGITQKDMNRWCKRHEPLREAFNYCLMRLGRRREIGAMKRKYDPGMVARNQWKYDRSDRDEQMRLEDREVELIKLKSELRSELDGKGNSTIQVIMQPIPELTKKEK